MNITLKEIGRIYTSLRLSALFASSPLQLTTKEFVFS